MAKAAKKSFKSLREGHAENLPTHASDASAETPDSLEGKVGKRPVKAAQDGKAIADAAGKHGNAQGVELPEEDEKEKEGEDLEEGHAENLPTHPSDASNEVPDHLKNEEEEKDEDDSWSEEEDKELDKELDKLGEDAEAELEKDEVKEEDEKDEDKKEVAESEDEDKEKSDEDDDKELDVKEHLSVLTADFLSEENKLKVTTLFEAAVAATVEKRVAREKKKLQEAFSTVSKRKVGSLYKKLVGRVDAYLDYIVEEWLKDNELAIDNGLRSEISESFIGKLKGLLEDHFVEVPESKRDVLAEQASKIAELEKELNAEINKSVELSKKVQESEKEAIATSLCEGLTALDAAKFKKLIAKVDFSEKKDYSKKLEIIKESYFGKESAGATDINSSTVEEGGIEAQSSAAHADEMDVFAAAISASVKK